MIARPYNVISEFRRLDGKRSVVITELTEWSGFFSFCEEGEEFDLGGAYWTTISRGSIYSSPEEAEKAARSEIAWFRDVEVSYDDAFPRTSYPVTRSEIIRSALDHRLAPPIFYLSLIILTFCVLWVADGPHRSTATLPHTAVLILATSISFVLGNYRIPIHEKNTPLCEYANAANLVWFGCCLIMYFGFIASMVRVIGDVNWFARSGGIVVFISGYWVLVADKHRQSARTYLWNREYRIFALSGTRPSEFEDRYSRTKIKNELESAYDKIRGFELLLLGTGTLVWALGDLIRFLP